MDAYNNLTNFEYEVNVRTRNGNYGNLQKLAWKKSWNHFRWTYFWRIWAILKPLCWSVTYYNNALEMNHKFFRNENGVIIDANCSMKREIWLWKIVRMGPECTCSSMMYPSKKKKKSPIIRDIHKHLLQWDLEIVFVNWPFSKLNRRLFSSNTSRLEAHTGFFRLPMKGILILMYYDLLNKSWFPN